MKAARISFAGVYGAAVVIMALSGTAVRAAAPVERVAPSPHRNQFASDATAAEGKAVRYDLSAASASPARDRQRSGAGAEWSPRVAYWSGPEGRGSAVRTILARVVRSNPVRYRVSVGRHRVDVQLTKGF
jgi:hypothetical protein